MMETASLLKILIDENIPKRTAEFLRGQGHAVIDLRGTPEQGSDDAEVWRAAQRESALLMTTDKSFSRHRHDSHSGLLIIRLRQPSGRSIHDRIVQVLSRFSPADWPGCTVVVRDRTLSIRRRSRSA